MSETIISIEGTPSAPQSAPLNSTTSSRQAQETKVRVTVRELISWREFPTAVDSRRTEKRHPFPYPIFLTPINESRELLVDETFVVIGKHLSELGVDFYFDQPLPCRRLVASFETGESGWLGLDLELTWCRFTRYGLYNNGGRFLQVTDSPFSGAQLGSG
ncbi:MAG: hypothetical protein MPJ24_05850 [Pirellulaceae bacterium]|nr:hypothetical protein [Pirellulaceae bacterium]